MFTHFKHMDITELLLRFGVAFSFFYPAISAWFSPFSWIGYFPSFILNMTSAPDVLILHAFGALELILGLWILWGRRIFYPALGAAVLLLLIVLFNMGQMDVVFRDISILLMAVALISIDKTRRATY